ncbi:MAG: DciA family protein [Gammaproteobacteria bacterium]|nr:DciA family protein [Gammaproteobacteria bacterium]
MSSSPSPVRSLLRGRLGDLAESARLNARTGDRVRGLLPPELANRLLGAVVDGEELRLYVDSPSWATRLRFLAPDLSARLAGAGIACRRCRVRVLPPGERVSAPPPVPRAPSVGSAAVRAVRSAAAATESGAVADALRRLARSLARRQPPA